MYERLLWSIPICAAGLLMVLYSKQITNYTHQKSKPMTDAYADFFRTIGLGFLFPFDDDKYYVSTIKYGLIFIGLCWIFWSIGYLFIPIYK